MAPAADVGPLTEGCNFLSTIITRAHERDTNRVQIQPKRVFTFIICAKNSIRNTAESQR